MRRPTVYPDDFRERAVRLLREWREARGVTDGGLRAISEQLGLRRETLRRWSVEQEVDQGTRPGLNTDDLSHRRARAFPLKRSRYRYLAACADEGADLLARVAVDVITLHEVALLRLVAQRLAGPGFATAADAVRWLAAVQAQDYQGALTSVALRTTDRNRAGVHAALDAGEVVRSWPMRGTLHFVAAEDLPWMLELLTPRVLSAAASRRARLGLDAAAIERARRVAAATLAGGGRLSRAELFSVWDAGGLSTAGQRGYHMLWHLNQTGLLCFGPVRDREQLLVLVEEWVGRPRRPGRDQALGELAWRYFASHGPATLKDFMRWTKLVAADARAGLALAKPGLARVAVEGVEHFMHPQTPELLDACRAAAEGIFLLPGFDEFILGYEDRAAVVAAEFASRLVPGANGMFRPAVVIDGRVVGTWKHVGSRARRRIEVAPFAPLADEVTDAVAAVYATLP